MTPFDLRRALVLVATCATLGATPPTLNLWPGKAPGEGGDVGVEHDATKPTDPLVAGRVLLHITDVSTPTLTVFKPTADKAGGGAVLVCPGGAYYILAYDLEGTEVCDWLNSIGVTAVLLKYRVPRPAGLAPYTSALQDAQRAMGLIRANAAVWGVDPTRVGVLGFSAGGNLAAVLSASTVRTYPHVDSADDLSCHPDFQVLVYPAYLSTKEDPYKLTPETAVNAKTPPTFLVMAEDDPIGAENILAYGMALKAAKIPMELHLFPTGGHGYGLRQRKENVTRWPALASAWMDNQGILLVK